MNDMHFHSARYFLNLLSHGLIFTYPNDWATRYLAQVKYLSCFPLNYKWIFFSITFCPEMKYIPRSPWDCFWKNKWTPINSSLVQCDFLKFLWYSSWELEDGTIAKSIERKFPKWTLRLIGMWAATSSFEMSPVVPKGPMAYFLVGFTSLYTHLSVTLQRVLT